MKTCSYCGKEYGDDAMVCATDAQPLTRVAPQQKREQDSSNPASQPSVWGFSIGRAFGWGLPILAGGLAGGKKLIATELAFNDNPLPLVVVLLLAVVAFVLGGLRKKAEVSDLQNRLENLKHAGGAGTSAAQRNEEAV